MSDGKIRKIVILGGGSSGWMAASALIKSLGRFCSITLVESDEIGIVGVGEATIPPINLFNRFIGVSLDDLVQKTQATIKLGIEFQDWRHKGHAYFHPFGKYGSDMDGVSFLHYWLRFCSLGNDWDINRFNAETMAAREKKFDNIPTQNAPNIPINHAYQFDAFLYAAFLREHATNLGVKRVEGMVEKVKIDEVRGDIQALELKSGDTVEGDFFVDCSGFRALLINGALNTDYVDWSKYLICDRALAVGCEATNPILPYTRSTACKAGWQWRIPLQHRTGNGLVYSSEFMSDEEASEKLLSRIDANAIGQPRQVKFTTGHRSKFWNKNVVALGLSCGFLEPLESTSIHLVQSGLMRLLAYFPNDKSQIALLCKRYNEEMTAEFESVRDFIIAHYKITQRDDTPFWQYCRNMEIPQTLANRIEMFETAGLILDGQFDLFKETSWFAVMTGQGLWPKSHHSIANNLQADVLKQRLEFIRQQIQLRINSLPSHQDFLRQKNKQMVLK